MVEDEDRAPDDTRRWLAAGDSEARLRALADDLPHAMIFQVAVGPRPTGRRFTYVGRSCERLNGVPAEAVLADADLLYSIVAPEHLPGLLETQRAAAAQLRPFDIEVGLVFPSGERRWSRISSSPRMLPDGAMLWDGVQVDITESRMSREALAEEQNRLALVVEATGLGLWEFDIASARVAWDETTRRIYGLPPDAPMDYEAYVARLHPEDRERVQATYRGALADGAVSYRVEHRTITPDGELRWILGCGRIIRDAAGQPIRIIGSSQDITERKQTEERLQLMVHELNHRVKNSMAVVQSIAARTLRGEAAPEVARKNLTARLLAFARAHDLLTAESWAGADLAAVAQKSLAAVVDLSRLTLDGPRIRLRPQAAVTFALVFHELATNALKYGALSVEEGRLSLTWSLDPEAQRLRLVWRETGGPPVAAPSRRGFGTQLIQRGLAAEAGGKVSVEYLREGLVCTIDGQVRRLCPPAEPVQLPAT